MFKKSNIILSVIIVSFIISVCSIGVVQDNPSTQIKRQDDDIITELSVPKTSGYTVTQEWKWQNTFAGDQDPEQIEISLDGNYIVSRWWNNPNATLFQKDSNAPVWIYEGASDIEDVAISGDGQYIVVCNDSHVICLDNTIETPKTALWEYDVGPNCIVDISLSGDYISAINTTHVILLDKNGQVQWVYNTGSTITAKVAISGDGEYIVTGCVNDRVYLFNTTNYDGIPMWEYMSGSPVNHVAISDDGNYAVASNTANELYFFNTTDYDQGIPMWQSSLGNGIQDIAISYDGKSIAVAAFSDFYSFNNSFSTGQKQAMWTYTPDTDALSIDITADGKYILGGSNFNPTAYLFNNSITNPKSAEWKSSGINIWDVAISGWGNYFVIGTEDQEIILFNHDRPIPIQPSGYDVTQRWNYTSVQTVNVVAVSANGNYMAVGTDNDGDVKPEILFFNTSAHDGIPMWSYDMDLLTQTGPIDSLAISANGKYIVAGCSQGAQTLFFNTTDYDQGVPMWRDQGCDTTSVDISADGSLIVYGGVDSGTSGIIYLCNTLGDELSRYDLGTWDSYILSLAISDDGKYVTAGTSVDWVQQVLLFNTTDYDNQIPMWSFDERQYIDSIAISADGYYIAAAGEECAYLLNRTLPDKKEMWNVSLGPANLEFTSIDISGDGKHIVVGVNASGEDPIEGLVMVYNNSASTSKKIEYRWSYQTNGIVNSVSITALGEYIVAGTDYNPDTGDDDENTVFLFNNIDYTLGASHNPNWFFNTSHDVNSVSISAWGNYFGAGGESGSGETFLFYHARPVPGAFRPYIAGGDDDDDDDEEPAIPFGNYYLVFTLAAIVALIVIYKRKTIFSKK